MSLKKPLGPAFRIEVPGANSVWVCTEQEAHDVAEQVMRQNGFGYIHAIGEGPSRMLARFEPFYGVVTI